MERYVKETPVSALSGVGKARVDKLAKLGVNTLGDLIYLFPRAYERRGNVKLLSQILPDVDEAVILTVKTQVKTAEIRRGLKISKFTAFDDSGSCEITFFNSPFVKDVFHVGDTFRFFGKAKFSRTKIQFANPKYEPYIEGRELPSLVPIYPLTEGINSKFLAKTVKSALDLALYSIEDFLPDEIRLKNSLPVLSYALKNIHFPESEEALSLALRRLVFDELLLFGVGISLSSQFKKLSLGAEFSKCDFKEITDKLPYELTRSQKEAVNDVYRDTVFKDDTGVVRPMARIVVGDVGSGKTICAVLSIYLAIKSGYQAALMAPTEILARQHYKDISALYSELGIKCELLLGSTTPKEKRRIYEEIKEEKTGLVIGTHALLSDKVEFANLGLVVTDEQHRFGVMQRASLKDKAKHAHLLVMSATPIPRTLALTMYGDLDVSRITEMPKGRMRVDTFVVDEGYRSRLNDFINKQVQNGGQCYIVCPAIEKNEECEGETITLGTLSFYENNAHSQNIKNVTEHADNLRQSLPNLAIEALHGKMKTKEKDEIMARFLAGEIDVLVSTTVIEVGINVPNASLMIIENADRFGLAQLHQLRGRVGRGTRKSYCVLVSDLNTEKSRARLDVMRTTYDGYEIAEKDLLLRGPGDFFASSKEAGMRQSGGFDFKLASLCDDSELLLSAFRIAKELVRDDPKLIKPENEGLRRALRDYIDPKTSTIS